jgi:PmbA protein
MLNQLIDHLDKDERISGWQVRELDRRSTQLFLNKDGEEGRRKVEALTYEVEVLVTRKAAKPGAKEKTWVTGNARLNFDGQAESGLKAQVDAAVEAASLVANEPYAMTEVGGMVPKVDLGDPAIAEDAEAQVVRAAEELRAAAGAEAGVRLVAGEFFAENNRVRYFNSQGVHCLSEGTFFSGEFCLLAQGPSGETEVFQAFKRRRLQDLGLAALVAESAHKSRRRGQAGLPKSGAFDVALSGEALDHFFAWCLTQSSGAAKYNRMTQAEIGDVLVQAAPGATPLTIFHNALIPWGVGSYKIDPSGTPGCKRLLIENGVLKARHANARYAQYLKQAATGELAGIEVGAGKSKAADLLAPGERPLYHLSDFSYFEPNGMTGEFSTEIRYGEEISAGGMRAVKGGSLSGLTRTALETARFSAETETRERYLGPKVLRLENLTLSGD